MMPVNLSIKEVPDAMAERLRARAERNHRSLQGELMAIIEQAASEESALRASAQRGVGTGPSSAPSGTASSPSGRGKSIEQIATEHRALYPEPLAQWPRAVDIIREDRDTR